MSAIVTSAEIERPAVEVFAYATDPTRFSESQKGVVDGHMDNPADDDPALGIGKILVPLMVRHDARKEMPDNMAALKRRMEES